MKKSTTNILAIVFALSFMVSVGVSSVWSQEAEEAAAQGILDGKSINGQIGEAGAETGAPDTFTFSGGQFHSSACDAYGYGQAAYTAVDNGDGTISFEAVTASPTDGVLNWTGTVTGDSLEGTASAVKPDGSKMEYWFNSSAPMVMEEPMGETEEPAEAPAEAAY